MEKKTWMLGYRNADTRRLPHGKTGQEEGETTKRGMAPNKKSALNDDSWLWMKKDEMKLGT